MEEKSILLKIELDATSLTEGAKKAEENLKKLTPQLKELEQTTGKNTLEYKKLNAEIKANQKTLNDNATALQKYESLQKSNNGSLKEMRSLLSAAKVAYAELTKEERENADIGGKMVKEMDALNAELLEAEKMYGVHTRNVGNYAGGVAELKAEIKELKGIMAGLDAGSEEYQQAAARAGELNDKLREVNENTKANTGGTGFEKMSNNLGLIKDDLMNLDFEGVAEKMKQMAVISQGMTFKEVLGGLKNMGSALVSLGRAILVNPLFLIAGAITGAVVALKMWNDSVEEKAVKAQEAHTNAIQRTIDAIQRQGEIQREYSSLTIRRAELEGKTAKEIGKLKLDAFIQSEWNLEDERKKWEEKRRNLAKRWMAEEDEERKQQLKDKLDEAKKNEQDLLDKQATYGIRRQVLEIEIAKEIEAENKAHNDRIKQQNETAYQERLTLARRIADLQLGNIELTHENERAKIESHYKFLEDTAQGNADEILFIQGQRNKALNDLDAKEKADREARIKETAKREIEDAKRNQTVISEINKRTQLELDALDIEYKNRATERDNEYTKQVVENNKLRATNAQKTADEIELIDAQLAVIKARGTQYEVFAQLQLYGVKNKQLEKQAKREIETAKATGAEKERIEKELQLKLQQLKEETFNKSQQTDAKDVQMTLQQKKDLAISVVNSAGQLADSLLQISRNQIQQELNDEKDKYDQKTEYLDQQLQAGLISQATFNAQKSVLDSEYAQKEKELKEKQFKSNKASQLINATIATAVGVASALPNLVLAGIAGALGAAQIAIIASQPTPKFAKGGILNGASHDNGGIKTPFGELEGGEAVINKRSTRMFMPLLSAINEAGGGKKFANGGILEPMTNNVMNSMQLANIIRNTVESMPNPVVSVTDIATVNQRMVQVVDRATL